VKENICRVFIVFAVIAVLTLEIISISHVSVAHAAGTGDITVELQITSHYPSATSVQVAGKNQYNSDAQHKFILIPTPNSAETPEGAATKIATTDDQGIWWWKYQSTVTISLLGIRDSVLCSGPVDLGTSSITTIPSSNSLAASVIVSCSGNTLEVSAPNIAPTPMPTPMQN